MSGRSLLSSITNEQTDVSRREAVLMAKERHNHARPDNVGYPVRAIRTEQFLYLRNLKTERWPMGDPGTDDFFFCGHEPKENGSYCEYHASIAYQPVR